MRRPIQPRSATRRRGRLARGQRGYILIALMLGVALIAIALLAIQTTAAFQARRDREEELIHRGVQYARAVRLFVKKNGRYPTRLEELENTNNIRFLRKRYKDPITGEDFKLLRMGDVKLTFGGAIQGAMSPIAMGAQGGPGTAAAGISTQAPRPRTASTETSGEPKSATEGGDSSGGGSDKPKKDGFSGQVFGGGPIVGVASLSSKQSIREFDKKNQYDQWQFIYNPATDRGGLLNTPAQPPLQGTGTVQGNLPQPVAPGVTSTNPISPAPGSPGTPPANNPPEN